MEGVGARLGRSSTRYGPTTVFNGPVRRWKKKWIHVTPPNSSHHSHQTSVATNNGNANGSNGSHLLLYKWTPITQSQNINGNGSGNGNGNGNSNGDAKGPVKEDDDAATEEPPRRKFKYIPISVLEEQYNEAAEEQIEDESKPIEEDMDSAEPTSKADEKPDINDLPIEENQDSDTKLGARQDLNESTLDLSLGLKARDDKNGPDQIKEGQLERVNSSRAST